MKHINLEADVEIELSHLTVEEKTFYEEALRRFRQNVDWLDFDEFAFGMGSPIYARHRSHLDVVKQPLYLALRDMWLQLGAQQGMVRSEEKNAKGRKARRGRQAIHKWNTQEERHLAAPHSRAHSRS